MSSHDLGRRGFVRLAAGGVLAVPEIAAAAQAAAPAQAHPTASAVQQRAPQEPARKKALFVYGGWEGHEPAKCRDLFLPWLWKTGFEVVVSETQAPYCDRELMKTVDLVVQVWTMGTIAKEHLAGLLDAVRNGTGLAGWHGGLADAYRQETEYRYMVGGDWVAHPGGIIDHEVNIVDHQDPITAGLSDFQVRSEQYLLHVNPNNTVLATTSFGGAHDPWIAGSTMPVVWKKAYGKGRVFYTSLGHTADVFQIPQALAITQRGMLWASEGRGEPTPSLVKPVYPRS
jgi:type 1 glutamine amidotransferase